MNFLFYTFERINRCRKLTIGVLLLCGIVPITQARIGDTKAVAESRFKAKNKYYAKDIYGFESATYSTDSFNVSQVYWKGYCVKSTYYKKYVTGTTYEFLMPEVERIAEVEASGKWTTIKKPNDNNPLSYFHASYAVFKNDRGTTLDIARTKRIITVETQKYRDIIELYKQEQQRKSNKAINRI